MDEKPRFREFYRARWKKTRDGRLCITDRKNKHVRIYAEPELFSNLSLLLYILYGFGLALSAYLIRYNFWENVSCDFVFVGLVAILMFDILLWRIVYSFIKFRKLLESDFEGNNNQKSAGEDVNNSEDDWNLIKQKSPRRKKIGNAVTKPLVVAILVIVSLFFIYILLNSYSFTYMRYLTEKWTGGNPGAAEVVITLPDDEKISLGNAEAETIKLKSSEKPIGINIKITSIKIPDKVYVYFNGKDITENVNYFYHVEYKDWYFWDSDYFKKETHVYLSGNAITESNTLEVKSGGFDKVWTFNVEQG